MRQRSPASLSSPVQGAARTAPPAFSPAQVRGGLDRFHTQTNPTFHTPQGNAQVTVPFRMRGFPKIDAAVASNASTLHAVARRLGMSDGQIGLILAGRASPGALQRITQGLIDTKDVYAQQLAQPGPADLPTRIREMMVNFGIGLDCAGYAKQAFVASHPGASVAWKAAVDENLSGLASRGFAKRDLLVAKTGDLIVLGVPPPGNTFGHTAIVYDARDATAQDRVLAEEALNHISQTCTDMSSVVLGRVLVVDASWGSGGDFAAGGVQRRAWIQVLSSQQWLSVSLEEPKTYRLDTTPYGHPVEGAYRLTGSP